MTKYLPKHLRAVLFDHDDTLVGTIEPKWRHHKHVAKTHYQKVLTDEEIRLHWGKPLHELVCELYGTTNAAEALAFNAQSHEEYPKVLFRAMIATLMRLKQAKLLVGIVTATSRFSFEHDVKLHAIPLELLDFTQTADDTRYHKPDGCVFDPCLTWLATKNIQPKEVLSILEMVCTI